MNDLEILVHIAAPSKSNDDARYHAQVDAIRAFEAVSRQPIFSIDDEDASNESPTAHVPSEHAPADEDRRSVTSGDELESVLRGHEFSPVSRGAAPSRSTANRDLYPSQDGTHLSSTHLQLDFTASLTDDDQTSPRHVTPAAHVQRHSRPRAAVDRPNTAPGDQISTRTALSASSPPVRRSYSDSASLETPLSVIPDSQPPAIDEANAADQASSEHVQVERSFMANDPPPPPKRRRLDLAEEEEEDDDDDSRIPSSLPSPPPPLLPDGPPTPTRERRTESKDSGPNPSKKRPTPPLLPLLPAPKHDISLAKLPLEIHPPRPSASETAKFETHITPTLAMLAERMKLTSRFRPARQSRGLHALERGYWLLRMNVIGRPEREGNQSSPERSVFAPAATPTDWSFPFFCQFWSFLTEFLREGRAGWGVWCILEEDEEGEEEDDEEKRNTTIRNADTDAAAGLTKLMRIRMKVYSWGEVVPHVYMLLYLATERRIRGMKAQWRDAGERVVIEMP